MLALAQRGDRCRASRITGQMKAADALDRHNRTSRQQSAGGLDRIPRRRISIPSNRSQITPFRIGQPDLGTTDGTGIGLCMKTAIGWVCILRRAGRAHLELGHAGVGPIVGDRADDAQPRPTMGAIGERIAITAIARISDLGRAGCAGCRVCNHAGLYPARPTLDDAEALRRWPIAKPSLDAIDAPKRWALDHQGPTEIIDLGTATPEPNQHALAVVTDVTSQTSVARQAPDRWPEANPLHQTTHPDRLTFGIGMQTQSLSGGLGI